MSAAWGLISGNRKTSTLFFLEDNLRAVAIKKLGEEQKKSNHNRLTVARMWTFVNSQLDGGSGNVRCTSGSLGSILTVRRFFFGPFVLCGEHQVQVHCATQFCLTGMR
jgi:hypothetical protein